MSDINPTGAPQEATGRPLRDSGVESGAEDVQASDGAADGRTGLRAQLDAAIRPAMLLGLQDAELDGPGGTQRINDWADWIIKTVLHVIPDTRQLATLRDWLADAAVRSRHGALHASHVTELREALNGAAYGYESTVRTIDRLMAGERLPTIQSVHPSECTDAHQAMPDELAQLCARLAAVRRYAQLTADSCRVPAAETARDVLRLLDAAPTPEADR